MKVPSETLHSLAGKGILSAWNGAATRGSRPRGPADAGPGLIETIRPEQGGDLISKDTRAKGAPPSKRDHA